jgi:hypothetical protein
MANVKLIYADSNIKEPVGMRVEDMVLPQQGLEINSVGKAGETQRRVDVSRTYSEPPSMFESAIFSMTQIDKSPPPLP